MTTLESKLESVLIFRVYNTLIIIILPIIKTKLYLLLVRYPGQHQRLTDR